MSAEHRRDPRAGRAGLPAAPLLGARPSSPSALALAGLRDLRRRLHGSRPGSTRSSAAIVILAALRSSSAARSATTPPAAAGSGSAARCCRSRRSQPAQAARSGASVRRRHSRGRPVGGPDADDVPHREDADDSPPSKTTRCLTPRRDISAAARSRLHRARRRSPPRSCGRPPARHRGPRRRRSRAESRSVTIPGVGDLVVLDDRRAGSLARPSARPPRAAYGEGPRSDHLRHSVPYLHRQPPLGRLSR